MTPATVAAYAWLAVAAAVVVAAATTLAWLMQPRDGERAE